MDGVIVGVLAQKDWFALLNVTVAGTGPCWFDPDGDKLACLLSCFGSQGQRFLESFLVGNDVIGWENEHCACMIAGHDPASPKRDTAAAVRSEEHTSELQSRENLVCRLLLEKKKKKISKV